MDLNKNGNVIAGIVAGPALAEFTAAGIKKFMPTVTDQQLPMYNAILHGVGALFLVDKAAPKFAKSKLGEGLKYAMLSGATYSYNQKIAEFGSKAAKALNWGDGNVLIQGLMYAHAKVNGTENAEIPQYNNVELPVLVPTTTLVENPTEAQTTAVSYVAKGK